MSSTHGLEARRALGIPPWAPPLFPMRPAFQLDRPEDPVGRTTRATQYKESGLLCVQKLVEDVSKSSLYVAQLFLDLARSPIAIMSNCLLNIRISPKIQQHSKDHQLMSLKLFIVNLNGVQTNWSGRGSSN